ncbi:MAG: carboxypeptidase regulatory-like domain-containing protein, partial [Endomicrobia bacterium]|nr:carboxypeptidase regulatory-like domain-containing protein [Endomicrobiia bacterium]
NNVVIYTFEDNIFKNANIEYTYQWDGKEVTGSVVKDGVYEILLAVIDPVGGTTKTRRLYSIVDTQIKAQVRTPQPEVFSPNNDGYDEETTISFLLNETLSLTSEIVDINNVVVRTLLSTTFNEGLYNINWDGKDDAGSIVPNGEYTIRMKFEDIAGNVKVFPLKVSLDTINGKVCGYIYEDNDLGEVPENIISGVQCTIVETGDSVLSDTSGYYVLSRIPAGDYNMFVYKEGYSQSVIPVSISAGKTIQLNIKLLKLYSVDISTISPPELEHYPVSVIGMKNNKIKLLARVADKNYEIKSVKCLYRLKISGEWYDWTEKEMFYLGDDYYCVEIMPAEIPDYIESIEYKIIGENIKDISEGTEEFNIEIRPEVTAIIGKQGGSLILPDGNPDDGECKLEIQKNTLEHNVKFTMKEVNRNNVVSHQDRNIVGVGKPVSCYEISSDKIHHFDNYITVKLLYLDLDNNGREDLTGVNERELKLWWYDKDQNIWRYIGGEVDLVKNTVVAKVNYLGIFGIFPTIDISGDIFRPSEKIMFISDTNREVKGVIFNGIHNNGVIVSIYDIKGRKIKTLTSTDRWDCTDESGRKVDSGIYIYQYEFEGKKYQGTIVVGR